MVDFFYYDSKKNYFLTIDESIKMEILFPARILNSLGSASLEMAIVLPSLKIHTVFASNFVIIPVISTVGDIPAKQVILRDKKNAQIKCFMSSFS